MGAVPRGSPCSSLCSPLRCFHFQRSSHTLLHTPRACGSSRSLTTSSSCSYFLRRYGSCVGCPLTIVGAGREVWVVKRRGRWKTVCARGANLAAVAGRSTSPLGRRRTPHETHVDDHWRWRCALQLQVVPI